jgi:Fe-S cluster assembly protein SufB
MNLSKQYEKTDLNNTIMTQPFGDISRETLDRSDDVVYTTLSAPGISESMIREIARSNDEPDWMLELRLKSLAVFRTFEKPTW